MTKEQVFNLIRERREAQTKKFGETSHLGKDWYILLCEEVGEVAKELTAEVPPATELNHENLKNELIDCAALISAWLEDHF